MEANSRRVHSPQSEHHPDLERLLLRHRQTPFQKPIMDYNRRAFEAALLAWQGYGGDRPLVLDAGCGVGWSTIRLAQAYPDSFVMGVDQSRDRLERGKSGLEAPENCVLIRADLVDFWRLLRAAGIGLQRHYLLYPNPWPKLGHIKRRWHGHPVFCEMLALGGVLECRSNWAVYVQELAFAIERVTGGLARFEGDTIPCATPGVVGVISEVTPHVTPHVAPYVPSGEPLTPFERKYQASGHGLWRLECDLTSLAALPSAVF